jgi:hypothetical protein
MHGFDGNTLPDGITNRLGPNGKDTGGLSRSVRVDYDLSPSNPGQLGMDDYDFNLLTPNQHVAQAMGADSKAVGVPDLQRGKQTLSMTKLKALALAASHNNMLRSNVKMTLGELMSNYSASNMARNIAAHHFKVNPGLSLVPPKSSVGDNMVGEVHYRPHKGGVPLYKIEEVVNGPLHSSSKIMEDGTGVVRLTPNGGARLSTTPGDDVGAGDCQGMGRLCSSHIYMKDIVSGAHPYDMIGYGVNPRTVDALLWRGNPADRLAGLNEILVANGKEPAIDIPDAYRTILEDKLVSIAHLADNGSRLSTLLAGHDKAPTALAVEQAKRHFAESGINPDGEYRGAGGYNPIALGTNGIMDLQVPHGEVLRSGQITSREDMMREVGRIAAAMRERNAAATMEPSFMPNYNAKSEFNKKVSDEWSRMMAASKPAPKAPVVQGNTTIDTVPLHELPPDVLAAYNAGTAAAAHQANAAAAQ